MQNQASTKHIVRGIMVSFDIFEKKDIKKINDKVSETFGSKPTVKKAGLMGVNSYEVNQPVWDVKSLLTLSEILKRFCEEKGFGFDSDLVARFVESFQVSGYDSPRLQFYALMAKITLSKDALNSSSDLRKDLLQVASAIRLYIESLGGLTKHIASFSPRTSVVTQLWVKTDKDHLSDMQKTEIALLAENEKTIESQQKRSKFSKDLRSLEPFDLSAPVGDVHSHILNGENVVMVLGHMTQLALGGLRTPYIIFQSYDEKLLQSGLPDFGILEASIRSLDGIVWEGYAYFIILISMIIYLSHIAHAGTKIDSQLTKVRDSVTTRGFNNDAEQMPRHLFNLSSYGTQISSLSGILGTFSRQWERVMRQISEGKAGLVSEVPMETRSLFGRSVTFSSLQLKGYLGTLADQILHILENTGESLNKQDSEIASLRMHISDFVNLQISKSNEDLQKSMKRLTTISIIIAIFALATSITSGWYGYQIATLDYEKTHPEGTYFVHVYFLGYDYPTNVDHFRITITYQGRGESRYLRLSLGIIGANSTVVSKGNAEVMEPGIILARNYVDGLIGWVDYNIRRISALNRTKLTIYDFSSDVNATIVDNS